MAPTRTITSTSKARQEANARTALTPYNTNGGAKVPRPSNAWILYRKAKLEELTKLQKPHEKTTQDQYSKMISKLWKDESEDVKEYYRRLAAQIKEEHRENNPNYKFAPVKKEEKKRLQQQKKFEKHQMKIARANGAGGIGISQSGPQARHYSANPIGCVPGISIAQPRPVAVTNPNLYYGLCTPRQSAEPSPSPATSNNGMVERFGSAASFNSTVSNNEDILDISPEELDMITPDFQYTPWNDPRGSQSAYGVPSQLLTPPYAPGIMPSNGGPGNTTPQFFDVPTQQFQPSWQPPVYFPGNMSSIESPRNTSPQYFGVPTLQPSRYLPEDATYFATTFPMAPVDTQEGASPVSTDYSVDSSLFNFAHSQSVQSNIPREYYYEA